MKTCWCFAILMLAGLAGAQLSLKDDFVVSGEKAYGLMPPEPICGGLVSKVEWSSDGRYLIAVRRDPGASSKMQHVLDMKGNPQELQEQSIVVYSLADRKASVIWSSRSPLVSINAVEWMRDTDVAYALISERERITDPSHLPAQRMIVLQMDAGSLSSGTLVTSLDWVEFDLSPLKPVGLIVTTHRSANSAGQSGTPVDQPEWSDYRVLSSNGAMSEPVRVPQPITVDGWTANGESPIIQQFSRGRSGQIVGTIRQLDLRTGQFGGTPRREDVYIDRESPSLKAWTPEEEKAFELSHPLLLDARRTMVTSASKQSKQIESLWLRNSAGDAAVLVADNVEGILENRASPSLSPTNSGVAYVVGGVALVRPLITLPKAAFLDALRAEQRSAAMTQAKLVGLALTMYSSDNDDTMPTNQMDIEKLIEPYLKDRSIFSGFVYTFGGGLISDVKDPAKTEMGYVSCPGGRAVVYLDGHVKVQGDK